MLPRLASHDSANHRVIDPKLGGHLLERGLSALVTLANSKHGVIVEFVATVTSFGDSIRKIILRRSKEKMVRSNARGIVAPMADVQSLRDWSVDRLPNDTSSDSSLTEADIDLAITSRVMRALPSPASLSLCDFLPKAFENWASMAMSRTSVAAKPTAALSDKGRESFKGTFAPLAIAENSGTFSGHREIAFLGAVAPDSSTYRGAFLLSHPVSRG